MEVIGSLNVPLKNNIRAWFSKTFWLQLHYNDEHYIYIYIKGDVSTGYPTAFACYMIFSHAADLVYLFFFVFF